MKRNKVEMKEAWGAILVRSWDDNGVQTRHWFDEVDDGVLVHIAEVEQYDDGRHYVDADLMMVPEAVMSILEHDGYSVKNIVGAASGYMEP